MYIYMKLMLVYCGIHVDDDNDDIHLLTSSSSSPPATYEETEIQLTRGDAPTYDLQLNYKPYMGHP